MVHLNLKTTHKEVPINDIIATGLVPFFTDLSENSAEFKGQSLDRFRLLYNGRPLNDETLKKVNDNDSIRVILIAELKSKQPMDEEARKKRDADLAKYAAPYKNPEDRRMSGFNHDFALPDHMSRIIKAHPRLVFDNEFVSVLNDWYIFRAYCIRNNFKQDPTRGTFRYTNPEFIDVFRNIMALIGQRYGFSEPARVGYQASAPPRAAAGAGPQPITQAFLQNALQAALAGVNLPQPPHRPTHRQAAPAPQPAPAAPQPAPQPAEEPMLQGYEQQAALLREYGFENDDLIQLALEQTEGNVEAAIELIIELQSQ